MLLLWPVFAMFMGFMAMLFVSDFMIEPSKLVNVSVKLDFLGPRCCE